MLGHVSSGCRDGRIGRGRLGFGAVPNRNIQSNFFRSAETIPYPVQGGHPATGRITVIAFAFIELGTPGAGTSFARSTRGES